ncbi:unnamed protein product [Sphagnum balticum]
MTCCWDGEQRYFTLSEPPEACLAIGSEKADLLLLLRCKGASSNTLWGRSQTQSETKSLTTSSGQGFATCKLETSDVLLRDGSAEK